MDDVRKEETLRETDAPLQTGSGYGERGSGSRDGMDGVVECGINFTD